MLKNQTVNHVSEHLSAICPVYTPYQGEGPRSGGEGYIIFTNGEKKAATINPKIQAKLFQPVQSDIRPGSGQC